MYSSYMYSSYTCMRQAVEKVSGVYTNMAHAKHGAVGAIWWCVVVLVMLVLQHVGGANGNNCGNVLGARKHSSCRARCCRWGGSSSFERRAGKWISTLSLYQVCRYIGIYHCIRFVGILVLLNLYPYLYCSTSMYWSSIWVVISYVYHLCMLVHI